MITNFVDNNTVITATWLNKVDRAVSEAIGTGTDSPTTPSDVKTNLGLNNVDNTSDANKPISTATQTALNSKQDALPSQTGNSGKYLTTNGTSISWGVVDALPSQTGNSGKYLTTNGTVASWVEFSGISLTGVETLTNKTLTTPVINTNINYSGTSGAIQVNGVDKVTIPSSGGVSIPQGITGIPAFSAYSTSTGGITSGVYSKAALPSEEFDTDSSFDSTSLYRFVPKVNGYYQVNFGGTASGTGISRFFYELFKNGVGVRRGLDAAPLSSVEAHSTGSHLVYLTTSDYIELYIYAVFTTLAHASKLQAFLARAA